MSTEKPFFKNIIGSRFDGWTVIRFYTEMYPYATRRQWEAWIEAGRIEMCGRCARACEILRTGDVLIFFREERDEPRVESEYNVVHEDRHIIVVDKPGGLPVVPCGAYFRNTLLHLLRDGRPGETIHPAHRLDIETSGLVVFTKTRDAARILAQAFRDRCVLKEYEAVLLGHLTNEITVEVPIGRVCHPESKNAYGVTNSGKSATTVFTPIEYFSRRELTLVKAIPETGRTHQIRIHAAHIGFPVMDDTVHGGMRQFPRPGSHPRRQGRSRLALHATFISFPHPEGKKRFESQAPDWFRDP